MSALDLADVAEIAAQARACEDSALRPSARQRPLHRTPYAMSDAGHPAPFVRPDEGIPDRPESLQLLAALQTTLDVERLIEIFTHETGRRVTHDGILYEYDERGLRIEFGLGGRHSCDWRLTLGKETLGHLTLLREIPFTPSETAQLDSLLVSLFYPLRNALAHLRVVETALRDPLTGIYNRAAFNAALDRDVQLAHRHKTPMSLVLFDIDHFKLINDHHGHAAGDEALRTLAQTIHDTVRNSDMLSRFGGEEFAVLLNNTDLRGAALLAERIRLAAHHVLCRVDDREISLRISVGAAQLRSGEDAAQLFLRADHALYQAKHRGRDRVVLAEA